MVAAFRSPSRGVLPFLEWAVFGVLGIYNRQKAGKHGLRSTRRVLGLARSGNIDERFLLNILPRIAASFTEIYVHPDAETTAGRLELAALVSPRVRDMIRLLQMSLLGYKDFGVMESLSQEVTACKTVLQHSIHQR